MSVLALNLYLLHHLKVVRSGKERHSPEGVRAGASLSWVNEAGSLQLLTMMNKRVIDRVHTQAIYYSFALIYSFFTPEEQCFPFQRLCC